jgi:very-short-patch-repair endonuclease
VTTGRAGHDEWHERRVVALAERQHGCVTTAQLKAADVSKDAIAYRQKVGWLTRLHRGVYRVGPLTGPLTREKAALLAFGPKAALSHRTAAAIWGLIGILAVLVDVSVPGKQRDRKGVRVHRYRALDRVTTYEGCRITTPAATIADLAPTLNTRDLARVVEQAQVLRLATRAELIAVLPGSRSPALKQALAQPRLTRSEAERRLLELIAKAGLPRPLTNVRIGRHEVDLHWPAQRLVVEVDGYAFHSTREAFERDRARDADLMALGQRVFRVTWRQIVDEPEALIARLAVALAVA